AGSISVIAVTAGGCSAPAGRSLCRPALRRRRGPWVVARLQVGHPRASDGELVAGGVELPGPGELVLQRDDPGGRLQGHALVEELPQPGGERQLPPRIAAVPTLGALRR